MAKATKKQLAINMVANIVAFCVQFGVNFFLTPYIVKQLGSEAYGFVTLSFNIAGFASIITTAFDSMVARFVLMEDTKGNNDVAIKYFNSALIADTVLAIVLSIPFGLVVFFASDLLSIPVRLIADVQLAFAFAFLGTLINLIFASFGCVYYVKNRLDLEARRNIEGNIIRAIALIALFVLLPAKIYFITGTVLIVTVYNCAANLHYKRKLMPEIKINARSFSFQSIKKLLSSGIWNSVNSLSTTLLNTLDVLITNLFLGAATSGIYALVKTVPNFLNQLIAILVKVFVPNINILYAQGKKDELLKEVLFSVRVMGFLATIPIGFLMVFGDGFFEAWVPTQDNKLLQSLSLLTLFPLIASSIISVIVNVYITTNKLRVPALVLLGVGVVNLSFVLILLTFTDLGVWTVPIVGMTTQLLYYVGFQPIYAARCLNLPWHTFYKAIALSSACTITMVAACLLYRSIFEVHGWIQLIIAGAICSVIALTINFFIIFNRSERASVLAKLPIRKK
ncbi:oligosaccharide flippase family protein [Bifidobacterium sp. SO4]|uniref:oligosaccharide flippase family protein n=1 Tax=Bifidobacterium sp. SO4 TaxID=2809030 RepID=UPI001BDC8E76|nr:oligosaccharide flippase family protein [Bifidobacterium sp. SO4]MBT1169962.1 oligosaccharide flippase family protein [Bifidobacterium sp. SO4]